MPCVSGISHPRPPQQANPTPSSHPMPTPLLLSAPGTAPRRATFHHALLCTAPPATGIAFPCSWWHPCRGSPLLWRSLVGFGHNSAAAGHKNAVTGRYRSDHQSASAAHRRPKDRELGLAAAGAKSSDDDVAELDMWRSDLPQKKALDLLMSTQVAVFFLG